MTEKILGHAQALHVSGAQHADSCHVIGADDAVGRAGKRPQFVEACDAALERVVALDDPVFLHWQSCLLHRRDESRFRA